jgi:hypothetical protein
MELLYTFFGVFDENQHYIEYQQSYIDSVFPLATFYLLLFGIGIALAYFVLGRFTASLSKTIIWVGVLVTSGLCAAYFTLKSAQSATYLEGQLDPDNFMLSLFIIQVIYVVVAFFVTSLMARKISIHSKYIPF